MQVFSNQVKQPAGRSGARPAAPVGAEVLEDADTFLGAYCLSLPNAQAAFRAARVTAAWLLGRGAAANSDPAPRIVGVQLDTRRVHHERVFERLAALQDELSGTCGVPVVVRWYLNPGALPPGAVPVSLGYLAPRAPTTKSDAAPPRNLH